MSLKKKYFGHLTIQRVPKLLFKRQSIKYSEKSCQYLQHCLLFIINISLRDFFAYPLPLIFPPLHGSISPGLQDLYMLYHLLPSYLFCILKLPFVWNWIRSCKNVQLSLISVKRRKGSSTKINSQNFQAGSNGTSSSL